MSSVDQFAEKCAAYVRDHGGTPESHGKMTKHIEKSIPSPQTRAEVLEKFNAILQLEGEESAHDSELDENEEDSGDDVDTGTCVDEGESVFDMDSFQRKGKFDQDAAETAFHKWKQERNSRKRPLRFMEEAAEPLPDIDEEIFVKKQRELTQRLIDRDSKALQEIDELLAEPDLSSRDRRKLEQKKETLMWTIRERESQIK